MKNAIVNNLSQLKAGTEIYRLMERHNPQTGVYYVFEKTNNKKSISTDKGLFDLETGESKSKGTSVYGSSYYTIMTVEMATIRNKELQQVGARVSGFEDVHQTV
jgi:hypothetical protein